MTTTPNATPQRDEGTRPARQGRLLENISALFVLQGLSTALPLITLPYLVRTLGFERYGLVAFSQAFAQYFVILSDYGFNYSATRHVAVSRDDPAAVARTFSAVLAIKAALALIGLALLAGIVAGVPRFRGDAPVYFISYLAVIGSVLFPLWFFQGIERMRHIALLTGTARILTASGLFVFVHRPDDYLAAAGLQAAGPVIAGLVGLWVAVTRFGVRPAMPQRSDCIRALQDGWHLFVSTAAVSLYSNTNVFLVGLIAGDLQAGFFASGEKIVRGVLSLLTPITQAIFPHINALAARSRDEALAFIRRSARWIGALSLLPSLAMLCLAPLIVTVCFGRSSSAESVTVVRSIAMLPFIIAMSNVLGVQTMIPFGMSRQFSRILVGAGGLNLLLAVPLVTRLGAPGAAVALLLAETFVTGSMLAVLRTHGVYVFSRRTAAPDARQSMSRGARHEG